jgi:hypothetical protein
MRTFQAALGLLIICAGVLLLLAANGWLEFSTLDIAAVALILSGFLFVIPGLIWRRPVPWLTALFIPGALAFAAGGILLYTSHGNSSDTWYLSALFVLALGLAFLAMYSLGPHARWLLVLGFVLAGLGLSLLAVFAALFGSSPARIAGAALLIVLGLALAVSPVVRSGLGARPHHS